MSRRTVLIVGGVILGLGLLVTAAVAGIEAGREGPTAHLWARLHPHQAIQADAVVVAAAVKQSVDEKHRPPRYPQELLDRLDTSAFAYLRYDAEEGILDPWGRPMLVKIHDLHAGGIWSVRVYSTGSDGIDDAGFHDDITMNLDGLL